VGPAGLGCLRVPPGLRTLSVRVLFVVNEAARRLPSVGIDCELGLCTQTGPGVGAGAEDRAVLDDDPPVPCPPLQRDTPGVGNLICYRHSERSAGRWPAAEMGQRAESSCAWWCRPTVGRQDHDRRGCEAHRRLPLRGDRGARSSRNGTVELSALDRGVMSVWLRAKTEDQARIAVSAAA
jgi:hypothetical protein